MTEFQTVAFIDNKAASAAPDKYLSISVDTQAVLNSWRGSLFSFEWLDENGDIKPTNDLAENEQAKRQRVEEALKNNEDLEKPMLGIGMLESIEIGAGRAEFLTLTALGHKTLPVHIPKSNESDFKDFIASL